MSDLVTRAAEFARRAHESIDQRRKYSGEPYIVHPQAVVELVASVTDDPAILAAAWLHDVVEDTPITLDEIEAEFGEDVARLVENLTDVSKREDGNRATRVAIDRNHTAQANPRAKTVKLADVIHNISDIVEADPGYAPKYIREKEALLEVLTEGDERLYKRALKAISDAWEQLHR